LKADTLSVLDANGEEREPYKTERGRKKSDGKDHERNSRSILSVGVEGPETRRTMRGGMRNDLHPRNREEKQKMIRKKKLIKERAKSPQTCRKIAYRSIVMKSGMGREGG